MRLMFALVIALSSCAGAENLSQPSTDMYLCPSQVPVDGVYTFSLELDAGYDALLCGGWGIGVIDLTSPTAFNKSCPANSSCATNFFIAPNTCDDVVISVNGLGQLSCLFSFADRYTLVGKCMDDFGYFKCDYEASLTLNPDPTQAPEPVDMAGID
jgi:hypothetical protein